MLVPSRQPPTREPIERPTSRRERWAADAKSGNYVHRIPDNQTLYLSLDDLSVEIEPFLTFLRQIFSALVEPQWSRLVVDLRRNGGGNNYLGDPLRREVARSRFNRPGGLYVLTGPSTFSAAQNLVNRLERETFAIFAGEPAGGSPRHFGDAKPFEAGAITLRGGVSTLPWFDSYPQDQRKWVMPDLLIPRTFADWRAGRDLVLDAVLGHDASGPADELQEDRILYFRRKSQSAEWKPFWLQ
jgi:hypothetical protein